MTDGLTDLEVGEHDGDLGARDEEDGEDEEEEACSSVLE